MESLTDEQRAEVDTLILTRSIIAGISRIMKICGVGLQDARELFKARYRRLRVERGAEFACGDEEYWSCYTECIFEAIANDW
jgi:hypothetical protein